MDFVKTTIKNNAAEVASRNIKRNYINRNILNITV